MGLARLLNRSDLSLRATSPPKRRFRALLRLAAAQRAPGARRNARVHPTGRRRLSSSRRMPATLIKRRAGSVASLACLHPCGGGCVLGLCALLVKGSRERCRKVAMALQKWLSRKEIPGQSSLPIDTLSFSSAGDGRGAMQAAGSARPPAKPITKRNQVVSPRLWPASRLKEQIEGSAS